MSVEIRVPSLGESVTEATVARWFKQIGDPVNADEPIVELETDKVTLEFNAPASGTLAEIVVEEGGEVEVGALLGAINEAAATAAAVTPRGATPAPAEARQAAPDGAGGLSPAVRKLLEEHGLDPETIAASGPKGNLTKGDVLAAIGAHRQGRAPATPAADLGPRRRRRGPSRCPRRPRPSPPRWSHRAPSPRRSRRRAPSPGPSRRRAPSPGSWRAPAEGASTGSG